MPTIIIGIILMLIGAILINASLPKVKEELKMVNELPMFKRVFTYLATLIELLDFENYLGWLLGLGIIFLFSGTAFILLTFF